MRAFLALALVVLVLAGCATPIPSKDDFGASALARRGNIPPGFRGVQPLRSGGKRFGRRSALRDADQRLEENAMEAAPGRLEQLMARCRTHVPFFGS